LKAYSSPKAVLQVFKFPLGKEETANPFLPKQYISGLLFKPQLLHFQDKQS